MARLGYDGIPPYSYLGGPIAGVLVLEVDKPMRLRDLTLSLYGVEHAQVSVQAGKSREVIVQEVPFLSTGYVFTQNLPFQDPDHVAPGTYRIPFHFDVPTTATPSLMTSPLPAQRGRFGGRPDGMYVEYILEAKVDVPWWIDPIDRYAVPVYSPRRVLGRFPNLTSVSVPDRPRVVATVDAPALLPGTPVVGQYQVSNPTGKDLHSLEVSLTREVRYSARGVARTVLGPTYATLIPIGGRAPNYAGSFALSVPNDENATGPFQGSLFATYWLARARLSVSFGFDVIVEGPLVPA